MKRYLIIFILLISVLTLNGCYSKQSNQTNLSQNLPNEQSFTNTLHLKNLHMVDKLNGWAITDKNVIKTEDGGNHWVNVLPLTFTEFPNGIKSVFLDQNVGWVIIDEYISTNKPAIIYSTTNGGKQWEKTELSIHGIISLSFASQKNGWVLSSPNGPAGPMDDVLVYHTTDGGKTWINYNPSGLSFNGRKNDIFFRNNDTGFITGMNQSTENPILFFKSTNSGLSWENQGLNIPEKFKNYIKTSETPLFWNEKNGIIPVVFSRGDDNQISFSSTHDGGSTWTFGKVYPLGPMIGSYMVPYDFIDEKHGWMVYNGEIYESSDGTLSWKKITVLNHVVEISFVDSQIGWAITSDANGEQIYKTMNSGNSWEKLNLTINSEK